MAFNINTFKSQLEFGGARQSLFEVVLTNPVNGAGDAKFPLMCRTASLPDSTIQPIETFYFGRAIKLSGSRQFNDWNVTIINDEDFRIRNALEQWSNDINRFEGNIKNFGSSSPSNYKTNAEVRQYSQVGEIIRTYKFVGIWPNSIQEIQLDWSNEAVQEFGVTFSLDYWYVDDSSVTGDAGGR